MAESDLARESKPSLVECARKVRKLTTQIAEEANTGLRCSKSKEYGKTITGLKKEIDGLKKNNERQNLVIMENKEKISELVAQVSEIKESSVTKTNVTDQTKTFMKNIKEEISHSSQGVSKLRIDVAKMEQGQAEISRGIRADIAKMKRDGEENQDKVIKMLKAVVDYQQIEQKQRLQGQRYASTSTLESDDTGFGEPTGLEELAEEAEALPNDEEVSVKTRINNLALQLETRLPNLVKPLARHLGLAQQCINDICLRQTHIKDYRNQLFDVIDAWFQKCSRERKVITMNAFLRALDSAGFKFEGMDFKVRPMPPIDQVIIEKNVPYLAKNMIVNVTLTELRKYGLLSPDLVNYILDISSAMERVSRLVEILPILGDRALPALIEALEKSSQAHIAEVIKHSYPNRFHQLSLPQDDTAPIAEVGLRSKQDDTNVKQWWRVHIKETKI